MRRVTIGFGLQRLITALTALVLSQAALVLAAESSAGLRLQSLEVSAGPPVAIALWYPTQVAASTVGLGAVSVEAARNAPLSPGRFPLILISHGTGGNELGHNELAAGLAKRGYIVAALRHPGDNHQDRSLVGNPAYFSQRPAQVSRVIDALLGDAQWRERIDSQRIGIIGHSAGGFTAVALIGAVPSIAATVGHCAANYDNDPRFCQVSGSKQRAQENAKNLQYLPSVPDSSDPRIKAAVLIAPVGAFFPANNLRAIKVPVRVYVAERDNWLVPKYHAQFLATTIAKAEPVSVPQGGHFMLSSKLDLSIAVGADEVNEDPAGFDRAQYLREVAQDLPGWFSKAMP